MTRFDAVLFDAGGVLVLPDPTVLGPLLAPFGGSLDIERHRRAHYAGMRDKAREESLEGDWDAYNLAYVDSVGVDADQIPHAAVVLDHTCTHYLWRWPIPETLRALEVLAEAGVPMGVVSNASGQIADELRRTGVCQIGDGLGATMRVVVDSHVVGIAKPDPRIFEFALSDFSEFERSRIVYVGDSVTMDVRSSASAGLHPVLIDPFDDHPGAEFERITSVEEILDWF